MTSSSYVLPKVIQAPALHGGWLDPAAQALGGGWLDPAAQALGGGRAN